jgi:thiamine-monophosphate kinase
VVGEGERVVTRAGAAPGDRIYLTSSTGESACGLEILRRLNDEGKERIKKIRYGRENAEIVTYHNIPMQKAKGDLEKLELKRDDGTIAIKWEIARPLLVRHLMPVARDSRHIAPYASAMLDVSDGLFIDLCRICDESETGAIVNRDKIPLSEALKEVSGSLGRDPLDFALSGGEDYEILFTASDFPVESYNEAHATKVSCIGEITREERAVINNEGRKSALKAEGYQHFGPPG